MSAVFTDDAVASLREMTGDKATLGDLMMHLQDLRGEQDIMRQGGHILARLGAVNIFLMPTGPFNVVLTTTPQRPNTVVVTGVYKAGEEGQGIRDAVTSHIRSLETHPKA